MTHLLIVPLTANLHSNIWAYEAISFFEAGFICSPGCTGSCSVVNLIITDIPVSAWDKSLLFTEAEATKTSGFQMPTSSCLVYIVSSESICAPEVPIPRGVKVDKKSRRSQKEGWSYQRAGIQESLLDFYTKMLDLRIIKEQQPWRRPKSALKCWDCLLAQQQGPVTSHGNGTCVKGKELVRALIGLGRGFKYKKVDRAAEGT